MSESRNPWAEIAFLGSPPNACYSETVIERMQRHLPPYRAVFAGKGGEEEYPWMIVGSPGWNMLGVLMSKARALWCADVLNRAHGDCPSKAQATRDDGGAR